MRNNLFRDTALLVAAVLLTTNFWSCSKDDDPNPDPDPTPTSIAVTGVTLDKSSISILVGASETLAATISPKDAANKKVTWKSDKPTIAAVDANGKVTGVAAGEATITVTTEDGGKTATCRVTVSVPVGMVTVTPATLTMGKNKSYTLTATVNAQPGTDTSVTWTSSDTTIATVDATGKVTAKDKVGTVTITATSKVDTSKTGTCTVKVSADSTSIDFGDYGPEEKW